MKKYNVEDVEKNIGIDCVLDEDGLFRLYDVKTREFIAELYGDVNEPSLLIGDYDDYDMAEYHEVDILKAIDIIFSHIVLGFSELTCRERRKLRIEYQKIISGYYVSGAPNKWYHLC
jgi:hypothetical protein